MKQLNVRLDDDEHAMLIAQAADDKRSLNAHVQWLIRQENRRRGAAPFATTERKP